MAEIKITLIFILLFFSPIFSQSKITGHVADKETGESLPYANVFLSQTTLGSSTDLDGLFLIENIPNGFYKIVVQYLGYELYMTPLQLFEKKNIRLKIALTPKPIEGKGITIELPIDKEWEKRFEEFERQFLGWSKNARESVILNPYSVKFEKDSRFNGYLASCDSFLIIENKRLGYMIEVILYQFKWNKNRCINQILPRFTELGTENDTCYQVWLTNRKEAYKGSFKHFISTIATKNDSESDYKMYLLDEMIKKDEALYFPASVEYLYNFISDTMDLKKMTLEYCLLAEYQIEKKQVESEMIIRSKKKELLFDSLGTIYNSPHVEFHGHWSSQRISDLLPNNYQP